MRASVLRVTPGFAERAFTSYVRGPDHPAKLRIVDWVLNQFRPTLVVTTTGGLMEVTPSDLIQRSLLFNGKFEPGTTALIMRLLQEGDVFVDVGANVGSHAIAAAKAVGSRGRVLAIEPSPQTFRQLLRNVSLNAHCRVVEPILCAVSSSARIMHLSPGPSTNSGMTKVTDSSAESTCAVAAFKISSVFNDLDVRHVKVLKIDTEGHETPVIAELLENGCRPDHIVAEYLPDHFVGQRGIFGLLRESGYAVSDIEGKPFSAESHDSLPESNIWARAL